MTPETAPDIVKLLTRIAVAAEALATREGSLALTRDSVVTLAQLRQLFRTRGKKEQAFLMSLSPLPGFPDKPLYRWGDVLDRLTQMPTVPRDTRPPLAKLNLRELHQERQNRGKKQPPRVNK